MLKVVNLVKTVNKDRKILDGINFTLPNKGIFFITGESGSGKTTLINILEGIDHQFEGKIFVENVEVKKDKLNNYLKKYVSIIFQESSLLDGYTCLENCIISLLNRGVSYKKAKEISISMLKEYGLENIVNSTITTISGGEKQRVSIVRCILEDKPFIFCDEPTGSLDELNAYKFFDVLVKIKNKKLIVVVCHNEEIVKRYSDGIIVLKDGKIEYKNIHITHIESDIKTPKRKDKTLPFLIKKNIVSHFKAKLYQTFALFFPICLSLFSLSVFSSNSINKENLYSSFLDSTILSISKEENLNKQGMISLIEKKRPEKREIEKLNNNSFEIANDYGFIFSKIIYEEQVYKNSIINYVPYINEDKTFYFDEQFSKLYADHPFKSLLINTEIVSETEDKSFIELVEFQIDVEDYKIIEEFSFLSNPTIYYPYYYVKEIVSSYILENISLEVNADLSLEDFISNADRDAAETNYSYLLIFKNKMISKDFYHNKEYLKDLNLRISNDNYERVEVFSNSIATFDIYFLFLMIISTITALVMVSFICLREINNERKNIALLQSYSLTYDKISLIYYISSFLLSFASTSLSFLVYISTRNFINGIIFQKLRIKEFLLLNFFGMDILTFYVFILLCIVFITSFVMSFSIGKIKRIDIKRELKYS